MWTPPHAVLIELIDILTTHKSPYLVETVAEKVEFALGRTTPSPRGCSQNRYLATTLLTRAEVTVLTSLVYISRARPHLSIALKEWALDTPTLRRDRPLGGIPMSWANAMLAHRARVFGCGGLGACCARRTC
ncbi:hypothetical protein C8F01DRAFT_2340 [Mycena amicta]|nr:hypothetical protein C8F01DRAFT_2340 [Mycena amicta]